MVKSRKLVNTNEESLSELNNQEGTFYVIDAVNYLHSKLWNDTLLEDRPVRGSLRALVSKVSGTYSLRDGVKTEDVIKTIKNCR